LAVGAADRLSSTLPEVSDQHMLEDHPGGMAVMLVRTVLGFALLGAVTTVAVGQTHYQDPIGELDRRGIVSDCGVDGDLYEDFRTCAAALNLFSTNASQIIAVLDRAIAFYRKGEFDKAMTDYDQILGLAPGLAIAYRGRALVHQANGDYAASIADFNQAIALRPMAAPLYFERGLAHAAQDELDQAISDYTQAISTNPRYGLAYFSRADAYLRTGATDQAIADVARSLALPPEHNRPIKANHSTHRSMTFVLTADRSTIFADGEIARNTAQVFDEFVRQNELFVAISGVDLKAPASPQPSTALVGTDLENSRKALVAGPASVKVVFNSPGGVLLSAVAFGQAIRKFGFDSAVGRREPKSGQVIQSGMCASACVFAYLGGVRRNLGAHDRLGIHQFHIPADKMTDFDEGKRFSQSLLLAYVHEMGIDPRLLEIAQQIGPTTIKVLERKEALAWSIISETASSTPRLPAPRTPQSPRRADRNGYQP
jgi:tetratricopeptide (TPR) repeat protein